MSPIRKREPEPTSQNPTTDEGPVLENQLENHSKAEGPESAPDRGKRPESGLKGLESGPLALPAGEPKTAPPWGGRFGVPWANARPLLPVFAAAAAEFGLPPELPIAVGLVESNWTQAKNGAVLCVGDAYGGGQSCGIMQVKPTLWAKILPDADWRTAEGNIRLGCALLRRWIDETGSWQEAIKTKYHPGTSGNGTTPESYVRSLTGLMAEIAAANTAPAPEPPKPADPLSAILGGKPVPAITYGWLADAGLNYYAYGVNHGTSRSTQHPGVDLGVPCGTALHAPAAGVVDCVGNAGTPRWGQACGAYADVDGGGVGNVTILLDGGVKLTLGHCRQAFVTPGQRVTAGQKVATVGSMNGCHVHIEVSIAIEEGERCPPR